MNLEGTMLSKTSQKEKDNGITYVWNLINKPWKIRVSQIKKISEITQRTLDRSPCIPHTSEMGRIRQYRTMGLKWSQFCSPGDICNVWRHCWLVQLVQGMVTLLSGGRGQDAVKTPCNSKDGSLWQWTFQAQMSIGLRSETLKLANCSKKWPQISVT